MSATMKSSKNPTGKPKSKVDATKWFLDSAASERFSPHKHLFESYAELKWPSEIVTVEGNIVYSIRRETITVQAIADDKINILHRENVTYASLMDSNLLSITLYDRGFEVSSKPGYGVKVLKDGTLIAETIREGQLFHLKTREHQTRLAKKPVRASIAVWHRRLAHEAERSTTHVTVIGWSPFSWLILRKHLLVYPPHTQRNLRELYT